MSPLALSLVLFVQKILHLENQDSSELPAQEGQKTFCSTDGHLIVEQHHCSHNQRTVPQLQSPMVHFE